MRGRNKKRKYYILGAGVLAILAYIAFDGELPVFAQEGDSVTHEFTLQSLTGGTTLCRIKTTITTSFQEGSISFGDPSPFVGGGGVKPLDILSADTKKDISAWTITPKVFCDKPPSGGQIFLKSNSFYQLQVHWNNPDGTLKQITGNVITQGSTIRVDDGEKSGKSMFVTASSIDQFLPEWPSTYITTLNFQTFGVMKFVESSGTGNISREYTVSFNGGNNFPPIPNWDQILVDKVVTIAPTDDFSRSPIYITSIKNVGTSITSNTPLDTFGQSKLLTIKGVVQDWRPHDQQPPRMEIFRCDNSGSICNQLYIAGQIMNDIGSSSTMLFDVNMRMVADSPSGLYKAKMTMPNRISESVLYFTVLNINTTNEVCETGVEPCVVNLDPINAEHVIFYINDYQDFVTGTTLNLNIKSGYTDEVNPIDSILKSLELSDPTEIDDRKDRLDEIRLSSIVRFATQGDLLQFDRILSTDLSFDYTIFVNGVEKASFSKTGAKCIVSAGQECIKSNIHNEIPLAKATLTSREIESKLSDIDQGEIKVRAVSQGTFQLITTQGTTFTGQASGAVYEGIFQRGSGGTGRCESSDLALCNIDCEDPNVAYIDFQNNQEPSCRLPTKAECDLTFGSKFIWNEDTQTCDLKDTYNPFVDTDNDGIPDKDDLCPTEPEVINGFEDEDGCPDEVPPPTPNNDWDNDGILNDVDQCPTQKEIFNGYQDEDGCPDTLPSETDSDGDGIPDDVDKCPTVPEIVNGFEDDDGCPDSIDTGNNDLQTCINNANGETFTCSADLRNRYCTDTLCDFPEITNGDEDIEGEKDDDSGGDKGNIILIDCSNLTILQCASALENLLEEQIDSEETNQLILYGIIALILGGAIFAGLKARGRQMPTLMRV